jgi:Plasma-membrane choline transporter
MQFTLFWLQLLFSFRSSLWFPLSGHFLDLFFGKVMRDHGVKPLGKWCWVFVITTLKRHHSLRLYSLIPLGFAILSIKSLQERRYSLAQSARVTELSISLLRTHWPLLTLSPALLFGTLLASLPFLSLLFRLFLIGYFTEEGSNDSVGVWHVRAYAGWLISAVLCIWIWSWFVIRGMLRTVCASVIGAWYFRR